MMPNKKVLHVVSIAFSLKYFIGNQFTYFAQRGVDFTVSCSESKDLHSYALEKGFRVFPIPILREVSPIQDIKSILALASFIRREKFDVVIAHTPKGGLIGIMAAALARVPKRVYFRHGLVFETASGTKRKVLIAVEKLVGFFSHHIVNVSKSVLTESQSLSLNRSSKDLLLGDGSCNGIDLRMFKPQITKDISRPLTVGFVGRLSKDKGVTELICGWRIVQKKHPEARLLLIGPFDTRDILAPEIKDTIYRDSSIVYLGEVANVREHYREMDIFILPSYREGFPTVVLEASASELPVITTRKTGCVDSIKGGITGIYTDLVPESIAQAIEYYLSHPEKRVAHGRSGREWMEQSFSEEAVYKEIEKKVLS